MNDFTKEELELMEWYLKKEPTIPDEPYRHLELLTKIQSLIDKYPIHLDISELELGTR